LHKSRAGANVAERVAILEHYFALRQSISVCKAEELLNKTITTQMLTKFWVDACLQEGRGHFQHLL
jgi:hypothetical protein